MNLLMTAPLYDSRGKIRYFIGAQVDVSGLVKHPEMESMLRLLEAEELRKKGNDHIPQQRKQPEQKDEFQELSEMLNQSELATVRKTGGRMHRETTEDDDAQSVMSQRPRLLLKENSAGNDGEYLKPNVWASGVLSGIYQNVRHPGTFSF